MEYLWLVAIACTHALVYCIGKREGMEQQPGEDAWIEVQMYEVDKRFEHMRWLEERKNPDDAR